MKGHNGNSMISGLSKVSGDCRIIDPSSSEGRVVKGHSGNSVISGLSKVCGDAQVSCSNSTEVSTVDDDDEQFDITIVNGQRIFTPSQTIIKDPYSINDDANIHIGSDYWI